MGLLDAANTGTYGHPEPTPVRITPVEGKAYPTILIQSTGILNVGDENYDPLYPYGHGLGT